MSPRTIIIRFVKIPQPSGDGNLPSVISVDIDNDETLITAVRTRTTSEYPEGDIGFENTQQLALITQKEQNL